MANEHADGINPEEILANKPETEIPAYQKTIVLESDPKKVDIIQSQLEAEFIKQGWSEDEYGPYLIAVREVLFNAIIHGNWNIKNYPVRENDAPEDTKAPTWTQLVEQEISKKGPIDKKVTIKILLDNQRVEVSIEDEGDGFDWKKELEKEITVDDLLKGTHRGMLFTKTYANISYNEKGNCVTLTKEKTS